MSAAAESVRVWTLKRQVAAAYREARTLWLTIEVAHGMCGWPLDNAEDRLASACERAQRLTLEWMAAQ